MNRTNWQHALIAVLIRLALGWVMGWWQAGALAVARAQGQVLEQHRMRGTDLRKLGGRITRTKGQSAGGYFDVPDLAARSLKILGALHTRRELIRRAPPSGPANRAFGKPKKVNSVFLIHNDPYYYPTRGAPLPHHPQSQPNGIK